MKTFKKRAAKGFALLLCAALLLSFVPTTLVRSLAADNGALTIGVMNDLHYYPRSLMGNDINAFIKACELSASTTYLAEALVDNALNEYAIRAKEENLKYLLIPGDLTRNGEYEAQVALANKLKKFEQETGVEVFVINGNHDIRKANATEFKDGQFVSTRWTEPEEFREIYADLGYDHADAFFTPPEGETAGMLSYAATLEGGYRLIALDGGCYSSDIHSKGLNEGETRGAYSEALMKWALEQIADAKAKGLTVIGLTHFNIVPHFESEDNLFVAFPIDNWVEVSESFADAGMHFVFTGHLHLNDVASHTSDNGETITDCSSASMLSYPCYIRVVNLDNRSLTGNISVSYESVDIDRSRPVTAYGKTYPQPYRYTAFALNFGGSDINQFANNYIRYLLEYTLIPQIREAGSLYRYLDKSFDLDSALDGLLSGNTGIGAIKGVTKVTLKLLIKNVCDQVEKTYLDGGEGTEHLLSVLDAAVRKITSLEMSEYPCTKYIDTFGFGSTERKGTFADVASTVLATFYSGDEDRSDDPFMTDVLNRFERGELAGEILDTLIDVVLHDLLEDEILANIRIDVMGILRNTNDEDTKIILGEIIAGLIGMGDDAGVTSAVPQPSLGQLINLFFAMGIVKYKSLDDVLQSLMDEYLTESQIETIAYEFYNILSDLTTDDNPGLRMDNNVQITYSGKVPVVATIEDLRLPSGVSVTFGSDSATTRNLSWYTKTSVKGTDIEIVPYSKNPKFTGKPTTSGVTAKAERVSRTEPGVDLGVIGIITYTFPVNRHTVQVTGLKPGTKYAYRVGDASRGWWSEVGTFETADGSDSFTFFHMSDSQGGIERHYDAWGQLVEAAFDLYPQAKFIMHTGDVVDSGKNFKQWNWAFNSASDSLLNTVMMPTTGNHEKNGENATVDNFLLTNYPEQDTTAGVYYSFDYNNAHFMVLNTNDLNSDNTLGAKQTEWLKADAAASDKQWKIVALHKAIYSNGSHYDDNDVTALRAQLATLMPELGIDVVLQGHDHVYLRTAAMKDNAVCEVEEQTVTHNGVKYTAMVDPEGTVYAIDGCAGVKYYQTKDASETDKLFPRAQTIYDATAPVFSAIEIDGANLYFNAYTYQNGKTTKIDSFAITKAASNSPSGGQNGGSSEDGSNPGILGSIPTTAGRQAVSMLVLALPVAATVGVTAGAVKRKREEEE